MTTLVGRETELGVLEALRDRAAAGRGGVAVVRGSAGVGRTALLAEFGRRSAAPGWSVHPGAADEVSRELPFAALRDCLADDRAATAELVAVLAQATDGAVDGYDWRAAVAGVVDLVTRWCAAGPVLLVLDDAQWTDPATVLVLLRLAPLTAQLPLVVVLATDAEPDAPGGAMTALLNRSDVLVVELGALDPSTVLALTAELLGGRPDPGVADLVAVAGGNPRCLSELLDAATRHDWIDVSGDVARLAGSAGGEPPSVLRAVVRGRLVVLPAGSRDVLAVAAVLGPSFELAELAMLADVSADDLVVSVRAATAVGVLRESGAGYVFDHDLVRGALIAELPSGVRAHLAARPTTATGVDRRQRAGWPLAMAYLRQGRPIDALAVAERLLDQPDLPEALLGQVGPFLIGCYLVLERAGPLAALADRLAGRPWPAVDQARAGIALLTGRPSDVLRLADRAALFGVASAVDALLRGYALTALDQPVAADAAFAAGLTVARRSADPLAGWVRAARVVGLVECGRWDDALVEIGDPARTEPADEGHILPVLRGAAALIAVHRGDLADQSVGSAAQAGPYHHIRGWALALSAEAQGRVTVATAMLVDIWRGVTEFAVGPAAIQLCLDLARMVATEPDRLAELVAWLPNAAERADTMGAWGCLAFGQGLRDADPDLLTTAAERFAAAGWPLYEGYAHEHAALALAGAGAGEPARTALEHAVRCYGTIGAVWDTERAEAGLRGFGVRCGVRGQRRRPRSGWDSLTETEQRVATLVADGLSNPDIGTRMFLSRRTVQSHVSSILTKTGLSSRLELAISVARRTGTMPALLG